MEKELKVKKIKNGTVIDHLPAGSALSVLKVLGIDRNYENTVSVALNVSSKRSGKKDVVKVEDKALGSDETNRLALMAPDATINIIKNYEVVQKSKVTLPDDIMNTIKCGNPNCITNMNEPLVAMFKIDSKNPIQLRCKFCERIMGREQIEEQF